MQEDPQTGLSEYRLWHLDRVLFGSNTILVFKYPLMNRKLRQIKQKVAIENEGIDQDQIEQTARKILVEDGLIDLKDFEGADDEDEARQKLMRVDDYTEEEI